MATKIMGTAKVTVAQMQKYIKKVNPKVKSSVLDMIPLYLSEGEAEGVRGDIAFAQSCLETGNFTFSGSAVTLDQNNFAGMGVTQNGMKGNSWPTPQIGIRAQIQHLKAYACDQPLDQTCVDTRFIYVKRNSAPYVEWLGVQENPIKAGWAAGKGYGEKILNILSDITESKGEDKMVINVHAGHNHIVPGASGYLDETTEDRRVKELVIAKLRALGHTVYDCTDETGNTSSQNLANIVAKCNAHAADLDVSIHFNAFNGTANGTEVWCYSAGSAAVPYAQKIVNKISALGFVNRGVKYSTGLYVLKHTSSPALLVECCFCDSKTDASLYNSEKMANAIVEGITGQVVSNTTSTATTQKSGWIKQDGKWWYRHADGTYTKNGWEKINGNWFWFDSAGWMIEKKWIKYKEGWYYLKTGGYMAADELVRVDGKVYYVDKSGKMCYTDSSGALK